MWNLLPRSASAYAWDMDEKDKLQRHRNLSSTQPKISLVASLTFEIVLSKVVIVW